MIFNIKKHLLLLCSSAIFIKLLMVYMTLYNIYLMDFVLYLFIGYINACYYYNVIFQQRHDLQKRIVLSIVLSPIFMVLGILGFIPALCIDIFYLVIKRYSFFGDGVTEAYRNVHQPISTYFPKDTELQKKLKIYEYNVIIYPWIVCIVMIFIFLLVCYVISILDISNTFRTIIIIILLIAVYYITLFLIALIGNINERLIRHILTEECDALLYCKILELLCRKYSSNDSFKEKYLMGLNYIGDIKKMEEILKEMDSIDNEKSIDVLLYSKNVAKIKHQEDKYMYFFNILKQKYERIKQYKSLLDYLYIDKYIFFQEYQKALDILKNKVKFISKLEKLNHMYLESICLYKLGKYSELEERIDYILKNAGTTNYITLLKENRILK